MKILYLSIVLSLLVSCNTTYQMSAHHQSAYYLNCKCTECIHDYVVRRNIYNALVTSRNNNHVTTTTCSSSCNHHYTNKYDANTPTHVYVSDGIVLLMNMISEISGDKKKCK